MNERESPEQLRDDYDRGFSGLIVILSLGLFWYFAWSPAWSLVKALGSFGWWIIETIGTTGPYCFFFH